MDSEKILYKLLNDLMRVLRQPYDDDDADVDFFGEVARCTAAAFNAHKDFHEWRRADASLTVALNAHLALRSAFVRPWEGETLATERSVAWKN